MVELTRLGSFPWGVYGRLVVGEFACLTVERPWTDNQPNISCIPLGEYPLRLGMYYGGDGVGGREDYPVYELLSVPGRSLIKIHRANVPSELKGCIALGEYPGRYKNQWGVGQSRVTLDKFMAAMGGMEESVIVITAADRRLFGGLP